CYANSLALAAANHLHTIAFPAISTGVYGYPMSEAAGVSSRTIEQFLEFEKTIEAVRLVFFGAADAEVFLHHHEFSV
ncbi:MAG TPA: macro domain-containing protein, partial [Candidatus Limnocylindria bacterium]|nr:macro domain-containing protein [Candidatus Limnocylindria bacterium]